MNREISVSFLRTRNSARVVPATLHVDEFSVLKEFNAPRVAAHVHFSAVAEFATCRFSPRVHGPV